MRRLGVGFGFCDSRALLFTLSRLAIVAVGLATMLGISTAQAQTIRGDSLKVGMSNNSTGAQKILVIPIVDMNFPYNPANRQINNTTFPGSPDLRDKIEKEYATVKEFWRQASYGILDIRADVPNCFYRTASAFPNAGEAPFQTAHLTSTTLLFIKPGIGVAFDRLVLEYVTDPADPVQTVVFTSDPARLFDDPDALVMHLRSQLGGAAADLEIKFVGPRFGAGNPFVSGTLQFRSLMPVRSSAVGSRWRPTVPALRVFSWA